MAGKKQGKAAGGGNAGLAATRPLPYAACALTAGGCRSLFVGRNVTSMQQGHCNHDMLDRGLVPPTQLQSRAREEAPIRSRENRSLTVAARIERCTSQTPGPTGGLPASANHGNALAVPTCVGTTRTHGATGRNPLTEDSLRGYSVVVLSGSKARKPVYLEIT